MAIPHYRLLDLQSSIFVYGKFMKNCCANCGTASLSEQQRRFRIDIDKNLLYSNLLRLVLQNNFIQSIKDGLQAIR